MKNFAFKLYEIYIFQNISEIFKNNIFKYQNLTSIFMSMLMIIELRSKYYRKRNNFMVKEIKA